MLFIELIEVRKFYFPQRSLFKEVVMAGKQAKLLTNFMVAALIRRVRRNRYIEGDSNIKCKLVALL